MAATLEHEVEVQDVEYQRVGGKELLARVYQPKGTGPFPAIVDIHGGAWNNGDRTNNAGIDEALAARGIVVAALDFRQPPEAGYPASVCDVNLGIRWLKAHASEFNGSASVGAFGNSSGGHLAMLSALRPHDSRYAALELPGHPSVDASVSYVVGAWPVIDPLYRYQTVAKGQNRQELVRSHDAYWGSESAMAEGNPQTIVDGDGPLDLPPVLYLLKTHDNNHPLEMQERFISAFRERGGMIETHTFEGLPEHRMVPSATEPETMRFIETVVEFARRCGG